MLIVIVFVMVMTVFMIMSVAVIVRMIVVFVIMMRVMRAGAGMVMSGIVMRLSGAVFGVHAVVAGSLVVMELMANLAFKFLALSFLTFQFLAFARLGGVRLGVLDDLALDAFAAAAAARTAVALPPPAGPVLALLFGLAMGAFVGLDQRLPVGDRNLVVVRMNFAEGEKTVAIAAIFDEGRLERRFYPRDLGEVDIAAQLLALGGLEIKFFDAIAADHNDPGLLRVGGIDQHFVGHFGTLGGGGRVGPRAHGARSGNATVHLIRG